MEGASVVGGCREQADVPLSRGCLTLRTNAPQKPAWPRSARHSLIVMKNTSSRLPDKPTGALRRHTVARLANAAALVGTDRANERFRLREAVIGLHRMTPHGRGQEIVLRGASAGVSTGRITCRLGAEALTAEFLELPREARALLDGGGRTLERLRESAAAVRCYRRTRGLRDADARAVRAAALLDYADILGLPIVG